MNETIDLLADHNIVRQECLVPVQVTADTVDQIDESVLRPFDALTLDCFDTVLWRQTESPTDVFYTLQTRPLFKKLGFTADLRMKCEEIARRRQFIKKGSREVTLRDIYSAFSPSLSESEIQGLMDEELETEIHFCFPYEPLVRLIKRALSLKKKVSIVSDTYLSKSQLKKLLSHHLGSDLVNQLSEVMVSCEFGVNKAQGLHHHSIKQHKTKALLHMGDHPVADVIAAREAGITAIHLLQYDERISEIFRLRSNALSVMYPESRSIKSLYNPFKSVIANHDWKNAKPEEVLGYACLGPLMVAFANDVHEAVKKLTAAGQSVELLFLLRDGYLPYAVYQGLFQDAEGSAVRISRFSAYAASFDDEATITNYLADVIGGERFDDMAKQCLFTAEEIAWLTKDLDKAKQPQSEFIKRVMTKKNVNLIISRSEAYRLRLMRYLSHEANVKSGDTLLLIDLGYSGTTQTKLAPVLKKYHNINMLGRYLLSLSTPLWQANRSGLIDPEVCDENSLQTLVTYVALLEQLCTTTDKSVIDFDDAGQPIYGDSNINEDQHRKLTEIQAACLAFAKDVRESRALSGLVMHDDALKQLAIGELSRLLFLPTQHEIECLKTFKFDLNLGTTDTFDVFDAEKGLNGLRTRGLFFMERNLKNMRMNYPSELRNAGIELALTLLTQHRHGLKLTYNEMSYRKLKLSVIVMKGECVLNETLEATPTYDGYFSVNLPIGTGDFTLALVFGETCPWLQLHSLTLIPVSKLHTDNESLHSQDVSHQMVLQSVKVHNTTLYEAETAHAAMIIKPFEAQFEEPMLVRMVFRPLIY